MHMFHKIRTPQVLYSVCLDAQPHANPNGHPDIHERYRFNWLTKFPHGHAVHKKYIFIYIYAFLRGRGGRQKPAYPETRHQVLKAMCL